MGYASDFCGTAGRLVGPPFSNKRHKEIAHFPCTGRVAHHHPSGTSQSRSTRMSPQTDLFGSTSTREASSRQVANACSQRQGAEVSRARLTKPAADLLPVLPYRRSEGPRLPWSGRFHQVCKNHRFLFDTVKDPTQLVLPMRGYPPGSTSEYISVRPDN